MGRVIDRLDVDSVSVELHGAPYTSVGDAHHVHGEYEQLDDLVRCGICHDIIGVLCGPDCKGARYDPINKNTAGEVCERCGGWMFVKLPHSA